MVGIAGPNGAGKSTLISMLLGFLHPDQGTVRLDGLDPRAFIEREGVAYLPELMTIPLRWTVESALDRLATLNGIAPAERLGARERVIEAVGIGEHRHKRLKALSKGSLQRLGLAQAMLSERRVVVFDEPTHGLDPLWTARFRELVAGLRRADRAILIASHNLDELERLCDRVAIVDKGRIQRLVDVREAAGATGVHRRWRLRALVGTESLAAQFGGATVSGDTVECEADLAGLNRGIALAIAQGALVSSIAPAESSLEEAFRKAVAP